MKNLIVLIVLLGCLNLSAQDGAYQLKVQVENIASNEGNVRIGVFQNQDNFLKDALKGANVEIGEDKVAYVFDGLADGQYAVSIYHDKNENGKLDTNFMGIPSEPYAFSNNAKGMFGPPDFEECKFEINGANKMITIKL